MRRRAPAVLGAFAVAALLPACEGTGAGGIVYLPALLVIGALGEVPQETWEDVGIVTLSGLGAAYAVDKLAWEPYQERWEERWGRPYEERGELIGELRRERLEDRRRRGLSAHEIPGAGNFAITESGQVVGIGLAVLGASLMLGGLDSDEPAVQVSTGGALVASGCWMFAAPDRRYRREKLRSRSRVFFGPGGGGFAYRF